MAHPAFFIKESKPGYYYFIMTARNGEVLVTSKNYDCLQSCAGGIRAMQEHAGIAQMVGMPETIAA